MRGRNEGRGFQQVDKTYSFHLFSYVTATVTGGVHPQEAPPKTSIYMHRILSYKSEQI
jgi:hypothetical protein